MSTYFVLLLRIFSLKFRYHYILLQSGWLLLYSRHCPTIALSYMPIKVIPFLYRSYEKDFTNLYPHDPLVIQSYRNSMCMFVSSGHIRIPLKLVNGSYARPWWSLWPRHRLEPISVHKLRIVLSSSYSDCDGGLNSSHIGLLKLAEIRKEMHRWKSLRASRPLQTTYQSGGHKGGNSFEITHSYGVRM